MKKKIFFLPLVTLLTCLSSCSKQVSYKDHLDEYIETLQYEDGFVIMQVSDLHWSNTTDIYKSKNYLTKLINEVKREKGRIDLIEFTGDQFMLSSKKTVTSFIEMMNQFKIPYATTWGNHDREATYTTSWMVDQFKKAPYSIYKEVENDDVYGNSNFVINLTLDGTKNSLTKYQIANLDSGGQLIEKIGAIGATYDYIRDDQVQWWKAEHDLIGHDVPTIMYFHIVQKTMEEVYDKIKEDRSYCKNKYFYKETFANCESEGDHLFDIAKENNVKAMFSGHCHGNDITFTYEDVVLGCGVKTGTELYYAKISESEAQAVEINETFDLIGTSIVTLHDTSFDVDHCYYNERGSEDFIRWVRY